MFAERDLSIDADLRRLREAREWAERAAREFGFGGDDCYQVKLAMSEAVANAIQHGSDGPDDPIHITARACRDALVFEVRDTGEYIAAPAEASEMSERGRGLGLVSLVMDEMKLAPGKDGSILRFVKRLQPAA